MPVITKFDLTDEKGDYPEQEVYYCEAFLFNLNTGFKVGEYYNFKIKKDYDSRSSLIVKMSQEQLKEILGINYDRYFGRVSLYSISPVRYGSFNDGVGGREQLMCKM